jgi:hypothetical protein
MSENRKGSSGSGTGCIAAMFLIMFTLKLAGIIEISWWVVTAPLWGSVFFVVLLVLFLAAIKEKR